MKESCLNLKLIKLIFPYIPMFYLKKTGGMKLLAHPVDTHF